MGVFRHFPTHTDKFKNEIVEVTEPTLLILHASFPDVHPLNIPTCFTLDPYGAIVQKLWSFKELNMDRKNSSLLIVDCRI